MRLATEIKLGDKVRIPGSKRVWTVSMLYPFVAVWTKEGYHMAVASISDKWPLGLRRVK